MLYCSKKSSSHSTDVCTWGVSYCGTHTCGRAIAVLSVCIGILRWRRARVSSRRLSCSNLYFIILHGHLWTESIIATKKKKKNWVCVNYYWKWTRIEKQCIVLLYHWYSNTQHYARKREERATAAETQFRAASPPYVFYFV